MSRIELNYGDIVWYKGEDIEEGYGIITSKYESSRYYCGVRWIAVTTKLFTPHKTAFQTHCQDPDCDYWLLRNGEIRRVGHVED